jgi:hypothetical protein
MTDLLLAAQPPPKEHGGTDDPGPDHEKSR